MEVVAASGEADENRPSLKESEWPEAEICFNRHGYYEALMGGARRKPALPIGGPAVTWQVAFWVPSYLPLQTWVKRIERFILALYHYLDAEGLKPHTRSLQKAAGELHLLNNIYKISDKKGARPRKIENQATRFQMFRVRVLYGGIPVSISLEVHDEYFTLSTIIDLAWPAQKQSTEAANADHHNIKTLSVAMNSFNEIITRHFDQARAKRSEAIKDDSRHELEGPYRTIYYEVWRTFSERIFKPSYEEIGQNRISLGDMFADFRGFVASTGDDSFIVRPASFVKRPSTAARIGSDIFGRSEALHRVDALLPWLKADPGFTSHDGDRDADRTEPVEFTLTKFLDNRVIYGSALGAQLSRQRGVQAPVTNITLARNQARWQLGRLVDRVQMLGMLRLAALYDIQHLIEAGYHLRKIDIKLERLSGMLLPSALDVQTRRSPKNIQALEEDLVRLSQQLASAGQNEKHRRPQIVGGLAHRAERSRYYRLQFERIARDLRERRIEGFPTYEEAATRRLGGIYELIDMIGGRYARLQNKVELVMQELQTAESRSGQDRLAALQRGAELAFFLGAFPYYLASFILLLIPEDAQKEHFLITLAVCVASVGFGVAFAWREQTLESRLAQALTRAFSIETRRNAWTWGKNALTKARSRAAGYFRLACARATTVRLCVTNCVRAQWRILTARASALLRRFRE